MADSETIRAWLKDNGHEVGDRGRIPAEQRALYDAAHEPAPGDVTEADFFPPDDEADPGAPVKEETRPRRPRAATTAAGTGRGLLGRRKGKTGGRRKVKDRVSLEKFTTRSWDMLARFAKPIAPATANCLMVQAPMAGIILEDAAKDTIVDRLLQPAARVEDMADKVVALTMPPILTFGIEWTANSQKISEGEKALRIGIMRGMWREAMRISLEVTEKYAEQIEAHAQRSAKFDADLDRLEALVFGMEPEPEPIVVRGEVVTEPEMATAS